jgi:DNA-binding response OmpR family regulator
MLSTTQNLHASLVSAEKISILLVSPHNDDHSSIRHILHHEDWQITRCTSAREASVHLETIAPSIVICERDLPDGCWKDVLAHCENLIHPPRLVVVSRHADENLWAEVLNLGGYDVLSKPFDCSEVTRVVGMAWRHWIRPGAVKMRPQYV